MPDFSNEHDMKSLIIDLAASIFEFVFVITNAPMEQFQDFSRVKMEIRLMADEIVQIPPNERSRSTVERAVEGFLERVGVENIVDESAIPKMVENLLDLFEIGADIHDCWSKDDEEDEIP